MPFIPEHKRPRRLEDCQELEASSRTHASQLYLVQGCRFSYKGWGGYSSPLLSDLRTATHVLDIKEDRWLFPTFREPSCFPLSAKQALSQP